MNAIYLILIVLTMLYCTGKIVQFLTQIWMEAGKIRVELELIIKHMRESGKR